MILLTFSRNKHQSNIRINRTIEHCNTLIGHIKYDQVNRRFISYPYYNIHRQSGRDSRDTTKIFVIYWYSQTVEQVSG